MFYEIVLMFKNIKNEKNNWDKVRNDIPVILKYIWIIDLIFIKLKN